MHREGVNAETASGDGPGLLRRFLAAQFRFLLFRPIHVRREDRLPFLALALLVTWAAGFGRYWDAADPEPWQRLGLVSVAYVFVLGLIIHFVVWPFHPERWTVVGNWLFAAMTSLPACLYAIPVERFMAPEAAIRTNEYFLLVVAAWRVALLLRHMVVVGGIHLGAACVTLVMSLSVVLTSLSVMGLESVTFEIMGQGAATKAADPNPEHELAGDLACLGTALLIPSLIAYTGLADSTRARRKRVETEEADDWNSP